MIPSPTKPTVSLTAMAATSRCLDPQPPAGAQRAARLRLQFLAVEQVAPPLPGLAAIGARRGVASALGQQGIAHVGERLELAHDAVAAALRTGAAGAAPQRVGDDAQRELQLERLHR